MFTVYDGDECIYQGLRAGAKSYLLKNTPSDEILEIIRTVATGEKHIPAQVGKKLAERMELPQLSDREREVLQLSKNQLNLPIQHFLQLINEIFPTIRVLRKFLNPIAMTAASGDGQLTLPVSSRDRIQGSEAAAITLVKYGNYQCSQCATSHKIVKAIQTRLDGQLRFVFRHFPCTSIYNFFHQWCTTR